MMKTLYIGDSPVFCWPAVCHSYYADRLDDAKAIYLTRDKFPVHGDGVADDSDVLQQAINKVQQRPIRGFFSCRPAATASQKPFTCWPGVRVIGYGKTRPVLVLGPQTRRAFRKGRRT